LCPREGTPQHDEERKGPRPHHPLRDDRHFRPSTPFLVSPKPHLPHGRQRVRTRCRIISLLF
jgi:hypothetical protein